MPNWILEPDRRYWRRRANRRVRKARLRRSAARWTVIVAAHLTVLACVGYIVALLLRGLVAPEFLVERIEVQGARRGSAAAIQSLLSCYLGRNLLELGLDDVAARAAQDPWVRGASAKRLLPGTLRVTVSERSPAAIALVGQTPRVVDATGHELGLAGPGLADDLPVLTGLGPRDGADLQAKLRRGVLMIQRLARTAGPWVATISELDLSRRDRISVRTVEPGPTILLDPERVERNVLRYLDLRPEIERRVGAVVSVDLRWNDRISVMPVNRIMEEDR